MAERDISKIAYDVLQEGSIGLWIIELDSGRAPRMYGDERMHSLLNAGADSSPEDLYNRWYSNIHADYYKAVAEIVERMQEGIHSEVQYPWHDAKRGYIKVRCGGTRDFSYKEGIRLQGYHQDITSEDETLIAQINESTNERLQIVEQISAEHLAVLDSLSSIYYSMHLINLDEDTVVEYSTQDVIKQYVNRFENAAEQMRAVMTGLIIPEHLEAVLEFVELSTIPRRMKNKRVISDEFIGNLTGWFSASFITVEAKEDGTPKLVLFTTRVIDSQKKREERLLKMSNTDGLTSLSNRRSYEDKVKSFKGVPKDDNFAIVSMDVNGLKNINDTMGHDAGDELITGAAKCMSKAFSKFGTVYRIGGDEFVAIISIDATKLKTLLEDFKRRAKDWKGSLVDSLSISLGYVTKTEFPNMTVENMAKIADKRMYEDKSNYYISSGLDRRKR